MQRVNNFLTFDIEEWYHANYSKELDSKYKHSNTNLAYNIDKIIDLCAKYDIKSTNFILGEIASNKPELIKKLSDNGHEIASHSNKHKLVYTMTPEEFRADLRESCDRLSQVTGKAVLGFRAPSWSIKEENLDWYYKILEEEGLKYSSSIYPSYTYLYGIPNFPQKPHYPLINGDETSILEIPQTLIGIANKKLGFAGGFYLRFFPKWFISQMIKKKNSENKNIFIYLHPREIDPDKESMEVDLGFVENIIHYYGLKGCYNKLEALVSDFSDSFITMEEYYNTFKK